MQGEFVLYEGRQVSKEGFRVFVYGHDNKTKCVNSWDEFEEHLATGVWFASLDVVPKLELPKEGEKPQTGEVLASLIKPVPKGKRK